MSVNPASDPHSHADSQITLNSVQDLHALLLTLQALGPRLATHTVEHNPIVESLMLAALNLISFGSDIRIQCLDLALLFGPPTAPITVIRRKWDGLSIMMQNAKTQGKGHIKNQYDLIAFAMIDMISLSMSEYINNKSDITVFGNGWIAWSEVERPNSIIYTQDNVHFYRDSMSNWNLYRTPNSAYFQHKNAGPNPDHPNKCYVHVPSRQITQGQIIIDVVNKTDSSVSTTPHIQSYGSRTQHVNPQNVQRPPNPTYTPWYANTQRRPAGKYVDRNGRSFVVGNTIASQESTSDLAGPVVMRRCRCEGCPGCDGTPGNCRCRCVHDA
jgi:hypothetical protein